MASDRVASVPTEAIGITGCSEGCTAARLLANLAVIRFAINRAACGDASMLDKPSAGPSPVLVDRVLNVIARLRDQGTAGLPVEGIDTETSASNPDFKKRSHAPYSISFLIAPLTSYAWGCIDPASANTLTQGRPWGRRPGITGGGAALHGGAVACK